MLYFAYGSNLLVARLRQADRCPSARPLTVARLDRHRLDFAKRSDVDGSSKCTVLPDPARSVHGVLYEIAQAHERRALDAVEGVGKGYEVQEVSVSCLAGGRHTAFTYIAQPAWTDPALLPYDWYRDLVLHGALEHGLPEELVARLRRTATRTDPDRARAERERLALSGDVRNANRSVHGGCGCSV
ncbi:MAG: gamma-glutamylcyclotransferase [Acidobacteria bacterium]|nr:MAG: gamma-glutamylcyclotransferase [Acidobacteriota bacterium]REK09152.1 MAG: gamma-glutamylcyclotransferase [Acidobacteriota bacterium]